MKKLLNPRVLIPLVLSASLIIGLLGVSDLNRVMGQIRGFPPLYLVYFLLLMVGYEAVRGVQWHFLLHALGIRAPVKSEALSFLLGEVGKSVPIGNFFQSYLLSRMEQADLAKTSAVSTFIILIEVVVSVAGVAILGIANWTWVRPGIGVAAVIVGGAGWLLLRWHPDAAPGWIARRKRLRELAKALGHLKESVADLIRPRVLAGAMLLGAAYLVIAGGALFLVARGLGATDVSFWQVVSVYFASLAVGLVVPLPTDLGLIEVSGVGALAAMGVERSTGIGIMLVNRALNIAASVVIALLALPFLGGELRQALRERPKSGRPAAPPPEVASPRRAA